MNYCDKQRIADICESLYKYCIHQVPQVENNKLLWLLNGPTLCNILYNVISIDGESVTSDFRNACLNFIRQPKGDIDITYSPNLHFQLDFSNRAIIDFQSISEEQRTYNFVDHNSELTDEDLIQVCKMTTKNNFTFYAKKPQYLFLYKFKEFLSKFNEEILNNDIDSIMLQKKNILNDLVNLHYISINYCGKDELLSIINKLPNISEHLHRLYQDDAIQCYKLIRQGLKIVQSEQWKRNNSACK